MTTPLPPIDPRDQWARTRRTELVRYAAELGIKEISEDMPHLLMVKRLKALGIGPPKVPPRHIGAFADPRSGDTSATSHHYSGPQDVAPTEQTVEVNAEDVLEREFAARKQPETMNEIRAELKRRGFKLNRRQTKEELKAILNGQQNPS